MDQPELCFAVPNIYFLSLCCQLHKQGICVSAVNTTSVVDKLRSFIWVTNSPLLANFLLVVSEKDNTYRLNGVTVTLFPHKHKGKLYRKLKNISYFDLLLRCEKEIPRSWSPPCCLDNIKKMYR